MYIYISPETRKNIIQHWTNQKLQKVYEEINKVHPSTINSMFLKVVEEEIFKRGLK